MESLDCTSSVICFVNCPMLLDYIRIKADSNWSFPTLYFTIMEMGDMSKLLEMRLYFAIFKPPVSYILQTYYVCHTMYVQFR